MTVAASFRVVHTKDMFSLSKYQYCFQLTIHNNRYCYFAGASLKSTVVQFNHLGIIIVILRLLLMKHMCPPMSPLSLQSTILETDSHNQDRSYPVSQKAIVV